MTVLLPGTDPASAPAPESPPVPPSVSAGLDDDFGFDDFGERLIAPLPEIRRAGDVALYEDTLATASRAVERLAGNLVSGGGDVTGWPRQFATETKRLRDRYAARLPDGPERDRFDTELDLFAKAAAVETRGIATRRRLADSRESLARALDGYADLSARALSPATAAFAATRGEAAIRRQVEAQLLSDDEAEILATGWRADVAARRARQFVRDDPVAARDALDDPEDPQTALLGEDRRAALRAEADRRARSEHETETIARERTSARERLDGLRAQRAFEQTFAAALADGTAEPRAIDDALFDGLIDDGAADMLRDRLRADHAARMDRARTAEAVDARLTRGETLDAGDPVDLASAETWFGLLLDGAIGGIAAAAGPEIGKLAGAIRDAGARLGFLPPSVRRTLDLYWQSGDPKLMQFAAEADMPARQMPGSSSAQGSEADSETGAGGDPAIQTPQTDRDAFRELLAAGLDPATAKDRVREMFPDPGPPSAEGPPDTVQQQVRDRLRNPDARAALRDRLLDDLRTEAARTEMPPDKFLAREQEIRDAVPADPAQGVQVAVAPALAVGGMLVAPQATAGALTAIGLGGLLLSLTGDTPVENTTEGSISRRTEDSGESDDSDAPSEGRSGSDDDAVPDEGADGDADRRRGRRARDSSKNERHGDEGRSELKAKKQIRELEERARTAPRRESKELRRRIRRIKKNAGRKRRGEEHSRRPKGKR